MKNNFLISIITVVKNDIIGLKNTAESVFGQSSKNWEWIIVDGGSNDGTQDYLSCLKQKQIAKGIKGISERDKGIYDAMNKGIDVASGEYVVFLNAGDTFFDDNVLDAIASNAKTIGSENVDSTILYGDYSLSFPNGNTIRRKARNADYIRYGLPTSHQAILFPRSYLKKNKYDLRYKICGDYYIVSKAFTQKMIYRKMDFGVALFSVGDTSFNNPLLLLRESLSIQKHIIKAPMWFIFASGIKKIVSLTGMRILYYVNKV